MGGGASWWSAGAKLNKQAPGARSTTLRERRRRRRKEYIQPGPASRTFTTSYVCTFVQRARFPPFAIACDSQCTICERGKEY